MRLGGFKHFNIGKRKFCITVYRLLEIKKDEIEEKIQIGGFIFNLLPIIIYEYNRNTKELCLGWLFWTICIEDETYQNMSC